MLPPLDIVVCALLLLLLTLLACLLPLVVLGWLGVTGIGLCRGRLPAARSLLPPACVPQGAPSRIFLLALLPQLSAGVA